MIILYLQAVRSEGAYRNHLAKRVPGFSVLCSILVQNPLQGSPSPDRSGHCSESFAALELLHVQVFCASKNTPVIPWLETKEKKSIHAIMYLTPTATKKLIDICSKKYSEKHDWYRWVTISRWIREKKTRE